MKTPAQLKDNSVSLDLDEAVTEACHRLETKWNGLNECETTLNRFKERLTDFTSFAHLIASYGEKVMEASHTYSKLKAIYKCCQDAKNHPDRLHDIIEMLEAEQSDLERHLLTEDGFRFNCTSVLVNVENMANTRAKQTALAATKEVLTLLKRVW